MQQEFVLATEGGKIEVRLGGNSVNTRAPAGAHTVYLIRSATFDAQRARGLVHRG